MKTLKLLLLLFVPLFVKAQTWQPQYLGQENTNIIVRKAFTLPKDSLGWGNIRMYDTTLQYKVGSSWRVVGSGGGTYVDSSNFQKISNKVTTLTNSATQYPSTSAIRDSIYTKSFTYTKSQTDSAIVAGGGSTLFAKNGLRKQGDTVKLGLELAPPYTNGVLTEDLYLIKGSVLSETFKGLVVSDVDITGITTIIPIESAPNTGSTLRSGVSGTGVTSDVTVFYDRVDVGTSASTEYYKGMVYKSDYSANYTDRSIPDVGWVKSKSSVDTTVKILASTNTATPTNLASINIPVGHVWDLQIRAIARSSSTEAAKFLKTAIVGNNGTASLLDGGLVDIIADMQTSGMTTTGLELLTSGSEIIVRATGINGDVEWKIYITINTLP